MTIRAQLLFALAAALGTGLLAVYFVTADITEQAVLSGRIAQARQVAGLVSGRFADVPSQGHAMADGLVAMRALVEPDEIWLLDADRAVMLDPSDSEHVQRFAGLVPREHRASLGYGPIHHQLTTGVDGETRLVISARLDHSPSSSFGGGVPVPGFVVLVSSLEPMHKRVGLLRDLLLLFTVIIIGLALIPGYFLLGRIVVRPLQRLLVAFQRSERGQLGRPDATGGSGGSREMQELFDAFGEMQTELAADRKRIQMQIRELELANTELASAHQQLFLSEKLASVGKLAAGVAHEVGNPLGVVQGYIDILRDPGLEPAERDLYLEQIDKAVDRASTTIRGLLDFARPGEGEAATCDAVAVAKSAVTLVRPQGDIRDRELTIDAPPEPLMVHCHAGKLEQVLLNLLLNAGHATQPGASIEVRVYAQDPHDADEVVVEVRDDGPGVPQSEQLRIFDPFYTTKDPGEGTGLGLAISYSIVESFGGRLEVHSVEGEGATFRVVLRRDREA